MNVYVKLGLTVFLGLTATLIFSYFIEKGQRKYHAHTFPKTKELFSANTAYDGLYLGSSRCHTTIRPSVIDSITGLSSYNGGTDAANLFEVKMIFDGFLASHPNPKFLVLTMDPFSFQFERKIYYPLQYFRVIQNPAMRKTFRQFKDYNYGIIRNFKFLRLIYYTDYIKSQAVRAYLGQNEFETFAGKESIEDKGFVSLGNRCMDTTAKNPPRNVIIENQGLEKMQGIIDTCKARGIQLILHYAPEYNYTFQSTFKDFDLFVKTVDSIATKNNLKFYRDDSLQLCKNPCLFANFNHVNAPGALEYSRILGLRLSELVGIKEQL